MKRRVRYVVMALVFVPGCADPKDDAPEEDDAESEAGEEENSQEGAGEGEDSNSAEGENPDRDTDGETPSCDEIVLAPLEEDPDQGFVDVSAFCLEEVNRYRAMEDLEPYWLHEDGLCCSALEARQAWIDDTHHNGDYCDWAAQGAAGGGRNPNGTAQASMEWVPRLFYGEKGDTYEESGGHYQAMMRPEPRGIACGWYGHDRDNHRVVVNYW